MPSKQKSTLKNTNKMALTAWILAPKRRKQLGLWAQRNNIEIHFFDNFAEAEEFLNYENSHILLTDVLEEAQQKALTHFHAIHSDPWLHGTMIIGLGSTFSNDLFLSFSKYGLLDIITDNELEIKLNTIMEILSSDLLNMTQAQQVQFKDKTLIRSFKIRNNIAHAHYAVRYIMSQCYAMGFRDRNLFSKIALTLTELVYNAIEHGNLNISHEQKGNYLAQGYTMDEIIRNKLQDPNHTKSFVHIAYRISTDKACFRVRDEGEGFDVSSIPDPNSGENQDKSHGRGILIARYSTEKLKYNDKGNQVDFCIKNQKPVPLSNQMPLDFDSMEQVHLAKGETLFEDNTVSENFYIILHGRLGIYIQDQLVAEADSEDLFIGEMSFLLNNYHTGTVKALSPSKLIPVSRKEFVQTVKKYPYFAVFLSRILAQRLAAQNRKLSKNALAEKP